MFSRIALVGLALLLSACGTAGLGDSTSTRTASSTGRASVAFTPTPTPRSTPEPSPTPSPTPSVQDLAQAYLAAADAFNAQVCAGNTAINALSSGDDDLTVLQVATGAYAGSAAALGELARGLDAARLEEWFPGPVGELLAAVEAMQAQYAHVASASTIQELSDFLNDDVTAAEHRMGDAGTVLRGVLGLPDRPSDVCVREVHGS